MNKKSTKPTLKNNNKFEKDPFLVRREMFLTGLWRGMRIFYQYMRGCYIFRQHSHIVTIFGSARLDEDHQHYQLAREIGRLLGKEGFTIMTGGGPGIMEAANRGAKDADTMSLSCNINIPQEMLINKYRDKFYTFNYFFIRKVMLTKYSSAFVLFPGGLGTLDEFFELATLMQTKKMKHFPVVLMGKAYWESLLEFMHDVLLHRKLIDAIDIERLFMTDSPQECLRYIQAYGRNNQPK